MTYKEEDFEIDNDQIRFTKRSANVFLIIYFATAICIIGLLFKSKGVGTMLTTYLFSSFALLVILLLLIKLFAIPIRKSVAFDDISEIKVLDAKSDQKKPAFRGTGKAWNYFPAGLNIKKVDKLFFIHQKRTKLVVGFTPRNADMVISQLREHGVTVVV